MLLSGVPCGHLVLGLHADPAAKCVGLLSHGSWTRARGRRRAREDVAGPRAEGR
ncbi:hypothetical protein AKJ08_3005 [Vulgatibacter incomptus]|uniref:Uncharacterized protein n=1 Tax=Vulgatibacter incomptus TaxID=1391653 RepID=A0A0K1PGF3_9BACT|nr:hypothetical protein AKJ08_3005 [Vulgatibacter incomptus]